jgi:hypothetical protein
MVRSSYFEAPLIDDSYAAEYSFEIFNAADDTPTNISGDLEYSEEGWYTETSVDSLPAGDYYIVSRIEYKDNTVEFQSEVFTVYYNIYVNQPKVEYSREDDTITVSGLEPYSDAPDIGYLSPGTAYIRQVTIYDVSGKAVMSEMMDFKGDSFYKIFYNVSEFLEEGQYFVTVEFSTYDDQETSISSDLFNVSFSKKDKNYDADLLGPDSIILWVVFLTIIIGIVIVIFIFILLKSKKDNVVIKWDEKEKKIPKRYDLKNDYEDEE